MLLLAAFLLVLAGFQGSQAQWSPRDTYRIDCGASTNDSNGTSVDGVVWQQDQGRFTSGGQITTSNSSNSSLNLPPYGSARIFDSVATYNFPVTPGRHWIRLHFLAFRGSGNADPSKCRFSVSIGSYLLLANFSSGEIRVLREFSIVASSTTLSIVFQPTSACAFVNGLEVISMAHDALLGGSGAVTIARAGGAAPPQDLATSATQTMYRVNVGGPTVTAANDSVSQGRTWEPDDPYIRGVVRGAVATPAVDQVTYPSTVPEYIAPRAVYGTARTLGISNTVLNIVNLTWSFDVDPGFFYYVRLHFAELVYSSTMSRIFNVYINNQTAIRGLDLIQQVPEEYTPSYRDFVVGYVDSSNVRIQIGPTPSSGAASDDAILNGLEIFKLNDTIGNVGGPATLPGGSTNGMDNGHSGRRATAVIVGAVIGGGAAAAIGFAIAIALCFCRGDKKEKPPAGATPTVWQPLSAAAGGTTNSHSLISSTVGGSPKSNAGSYFYAGSVAGSGNNGRYFTFQELVEATEGFDESRLLGVGGFGRVYKGELDGGTLEIAVKRGSPRSEQGQAEFQAEIELLSKLRHRHLVSLIGYCDEQDEMILVYEFMARGPLRGHLYGPGNAPRLTWKQRLDICVAAARGLHYLHTGADHSRAVIHRDVKTTNILLDEQFVAKVSDFGLSKTGPMLDQTHVSTAVKGSFGYLDPEYFRRQQLTDKSDVYSFGVVLIEVMCARPAIDPSLPREQVNIAEWAMEAKRRGFLSDILDPRLQGDADAASLAKVVEIAEKCLAEQGVERPTMGHVLWNLEAALHMQEGAEQRRAAAPGGAGDVEMAARSAAIPTSTAVAARSDDPAPEEDDYDGYSEDTSASAVFSQLVHPRGR